MKLHKITWWLLIIGGLNWGLEALGTGIGHWVGDTLARIIYALVGLSALAQLFWKKGMMMKMKSSQPMQGQQMGQHM